jgi:hypothetical protein
VTEDTALIRLSRLHGIAALLDLIGLASVLLQAWFFVPVAEADHRVLMLVACVVPVAGVVFLMAPRRASLTAETHAERRSLLVYATLAVPVVVTLLTLLPVAVAKSFDSFAGFALLIAADAGRNLCEWLRTRP